MSKDTKQKRAPDAPEHRFPSGMRKETHLTPARRAKFIQELAQHGVVVEAARAASPNSVAVSGAKASFYSLRKRDPGFARQWDEAIEIADARIEKELIRRAVEGVERPFVQKAQIVRDENGQPVTERVFSDRLMEVLARARLKRFQDRKTIEVEHRMAADSIAYLSMADIRSLNEDQRHQLAGILNTIQAARRARGHEPEQIEDAEYEEITEEPTGPLQIAESTDTPINGLSAEEQKELEAIL